MAGNRRLDHLVALDSPERLADLSVLSESERHELPGHWRFWARPEQLPPDGDWRVWLVMAGRGFGKTRAGAEWVREIAEAEPGARIALVAATLGEARATMVEGESGILALSTPGSQPAFEPSLRRLSWPNGAQATLFSAGEPDSLRGPQHSHACRPGAERGFRQRGARACRRAPALCDRRRNRHTAVEPRRWRELAGRRFRYRRLGRQGRHDRLSSGRQLAVRHPS